MRPPAGPHNVRLAGIAGAIAASVLSGGAAAHDGGMAAGAEKRVQKAFDSLYADACQQGDAAAPIEPDVHSTTFTYDQAGDQGEPQDFALYRYHCFFGAYNQTHVYFAVNHYGEITPVSFAVPVFEVTNVDGDSANAVESITITGFTAENMLINSEVDPASMTVRSMSRWRGLGDASSSGTWRFEEGQFVLEAFDVDGSYDGAVNPRRIFGEGAPSYGEGHD